jgi:hypothetical protein
VDVRDSGGIDRRLEGDEEIRLVAAIAGGSGSGMPAVQSR